MDAPLIDPTQRSGEHALTMELMHFAVLASDYDGTLATNGELRSATADALRRLASSGRRLILVTGRTLEELRVADVDRHLFDAVVAENGAVLWMRETDEEYLLAAPIGDETVEALEERGISPLHVGRVIASTHIDQAAALQRAIDELGLGLILSANKRSLMLLPPEVDKEMGLRAALGRLGQTLETTVACGDAENDIPMLTAVGCGVAVANALPEVKRIADIVTGADHGEGVVEIIEGILNDDLATKLGSAERRAAG